ncbi:MAG: HAD-IC family P-type ATPase [Gammaproteobacteria bacterium]|jgi:magnesium-transporting ATPase (P-type)|nr:HAD-IC family P-type ATPase [Gammaproteobacteria bacterium]MBT4608155.1 HAD-IC family P-type ATPase [Thiotrichales bacterium]MBT3471961.1 HAD-IC family P-type ATPase [Gammaproteobacteria bacterium]MBT3965959.1 HAD-IC family P-type ATPase [Gammaproteobacteria bacterium]MBT4080375.1 HAD-IC family P-type ATPase [Gammaproteobacteria bacterium]
MVEQPHTQTAEALLQLLQGSEQGISEQQVVERQRELGLNRLPHPPGRSLVALFIRQFFSPLIYVLLFAALLSIGLGHTFDALFIAAVLLLNAVIGSAQERSAEKSADALRSMVRTLTTVVREGQPQEIDAEQLVPGDWVSLASGDRVPADLRLVESNGLEVDESHLTGESLAVSKQSEILCDAEVVVGDRFNMLFSGSMVVRGRCQGVVTATGAATEIGQIADSLSSVESAKPPLLLRMERFTKMIAIAVGVIALLLMMIELLLGTPLEAVFMLAVALAVSVIPEGLPVAITVALAIGATRMSHRNVVVRRLYAVEALGSCTYIASDKTGTLTQNKMSTRVVAIPGETPWRITSGYRSAPMSAGLFEEKPLLEKVEQQRLKHLARCVALNNEAWLEQQGEEWVQHGDTVDIALLLFAQQLGIDRKQALEQTPLIAEIPFEAENRYSATLHKTEEGAEIFLKGALEALLPMCDKMATPQGDVAIHKVQLLEQAEQLAADGYRVLAVASGDLTVAQSEVLNPEVLKPESLQGMSLLGLVGMIDPLRPEVSAAIRSCGDAGVEVAMVTGDHPTTALAIARELGMASTTAQVVNGVELQQAEVQGEGAVDQLIQRARVFARVDPSQKVLITRALMRSGHFVAMTGDGANDAPALNAANVGVSMGKGGTDVARESSDLILADDHFNSIVAGIEEGRVAYANVRKVIFLLISTGAAEVVLFFLALIAGVPLPLLPAQLLWLNLVTNGIQDVALAFEPAEGDEMRKPPRSPDEPIFNRIMVERILVSSLVMGVTAFIVYWQLTHALGFSVEAARNSTLLLMVLFENVHVFNCRSETLSVFSHSPLRNRLLLFGTVLAQLIHVGAMHLPWLQRVLGVAPIGFEEWLQLLVIALILVVVMELQKRVQQWRSQSVGA